MDHGTRSMFVDVALGYLGLGWRVKLHCAGCCRVRCDTLRYRNQHRVWEYAPQYTRVFRVAGVVFVALHRAEPRATGPDGPLIA